ncbi:hypothetical protein JMJ76_0015297 [Colletotrichum scovillei]|nr:hypothetical protein JMJ76_0015297 [Colletotrichum scovillei]KAG7085091.1 hypothetical protein JMJ78_0010519 [Colletotrichum scovillei]
MISVLAADQEHARGKSMPPKSITQRPQPTAICTTLLQSALLIVALVKSGPLSPTVVELWCGAVRLSFLTNPRPGPFSRTTGPTSFTCDLLPSIG